MVAGCRWGGRRAGRPFCRGLKLELDVGGVVAASAGVSGCHARASALRARCRRELAEGTDQAIWPDTQPYVDQLKQRYIKTHDSERRMRDDVVRERCVRGTISTSGKKSPGKAPLFIDVAGCDPRRAQGGGDARREILGWRRELRGLTRVLGGAWWGAGATSQHAGR